MGARHLLDGPRGPQRVPPVVAGAAGGVLGGRACDPDGGGDGVGAGDGCGEGEGDEARVPPVEDVDVSYGDAEGEEVGCVAERCEDLWVVCFVECGKRERVGAAK